MVIEIAHAFQKASQGFLGVARRIDEADEFVPAPAGHATGLTDDFLSLMPHTGKDFIAPKVAAGIVDVFEVVHVEHEYERPFPEFPAQDGIEAFPVHEPGEFVRGGKQGHEFVVARYGPRNQQQDQDDDARHDEDVLPKLRKE